MTFRLWLPAVWVAIGAFIIYGHSIVVGVFQYDDLHSIVGNQRLQSLAQVPSYFTDPGAFSSLSFGGMFRPLLLTSYAITDAVAGQNPAAYHFGNVAIHALVGVLVTALLLRLGSGAAGAVFGGLVFVAHPVNVEAATYVSSRSESMCTLFLLITLWIWCGGPARSAWRLVLGPCVFALALLSKSVGIILPALLLAHDAMHHLVVLAEPGLVAGVSVASWAILGCCRYLSGLCFKQSGSCSAHRSRARSGRTGGDPDEGARLLPAE